MISKGPKMIGNKGNKEKDYEQAQNEHKENFDIFEGLFEIENRDDINPKVGHTVDTFSIHNHIEKYNLAKRPFSESEDGTMAHLAIPF
ncbi:MAG: hypothetical protein IPI52_08165 [Bacteroidetes bacterium]|nr:hypothetical protein [Bacteroidota bacterium]